MGILSKISEQSDGIEEEILIEIFVEEEQSLHVYVLHLKACPCALKCYPHHEHIDISTRKGTHFAKTHLVVLSKLLALLL
jgi:hypothetical protein